MKIQFIDIHPEVKVQAGFSIIGNLCGEIGLFFWCDTEKYDFAFMNTTENGRNEHRIIIYKDDESQTKLGIVEFISESDIEDTILCGEMYHGGQPHKGDFSWLYVDKSSDEIKYQYERINVE